MFKIILIFLNFILHKDCPYDPNKDSILQRAKGMIDVDD